MRVAGAVGPRRAGHLAVIEVAGDAADTAPGQPLGEDPPHLIGRGGVGFQPMEAPAPGGVGPVRVQSGVDEPVAVGRPAAQMPILQLGLRKSCGLYVSRVSVHSVVNR